LFIAGLRGVVLTLSHADDPLGSIRPDDTPEADGGDETDGPPATEGTDETAGAAGLAGTAPWPRPRIAA